MNTFKKIFKETGFSKAVIALSGGVDSATSCTLTVKALGARNVYPLLLPYGSLNDQGTKDALIATQFLSIPRKNVSTVNIKPVVDAIVSLDPKIDNIRRGNVMARVRMIFVFDRAKKINALVVGTENKTEHLLGYFTRFGDEASDIEPLRNLYKTQVYELAKHLGIPEQIIQKLPTAGLWQGQTDEGEFGFTYKEADEILRLVVDEGKTIAEVVAKGYDLTTVEKVVVRMKSNNFKHNLPFLP